MKFLKWLAFGFFGAVALAIVFVQAGTTGESGGKQAGEILRSFGQAGATVATALEGRG